MKKLLLVILAATIILASFYGCDNQSPEEQATPQSAGTAQTDVWDGSTATAFEKGNGSGSDPYVIARASQFAFLAQEVNAGNEYVGKYFSLQANLDLNNLEWTPIGNGTYSFCGIFDGGNHTISNLKIINSMDFTRDTSTKTYKQYAIGLFGSCKDAIIKNIAIEKASVTIQNITNASAIMGGVLMGTMRSNSTAEISNISLSDTTITCAFELVNDSSSLRIGGIIGYLFGNDDSSIVMKNIDANTNISIKNGNASYNFVGGLVGAASTTNLFDVSNCSSYLSVNIDTENPYSQHKYFGAFGSTLAKNDIVSISNVFSKITTNKINVISHGYSAYNANAIIGETSHAKQKDGTTIGGYKFQNLFGYVEQVDASTGETSKSTQLYELPDHVLYNEANCLGCESLPTDHGFDASAWDLTDLLRPKVKMN